MKKVIVLIGQYVVVRNKDEIDEIHSPGAQTCAVVILRSKEGMAVAHIDNPFHGKGLVKSMVEELKQMNSQSTITATIVGGDYGIPGLTSDSRSTINPIYEALNENKISVKHNDYSYTGDLQFLLPATYVIGRLLNLVGPTSYIDTFLCFVGVVLIQMLIGKIMKSAGVINNNYNVKVNVKTGDVEAKLCSLSDSVKVIADAPASQISFFKARATIPPRDKRFVNQLEMQRITPG